MNEQMFLKDNIQPADRCRLCANVWGLETLNPNEKQHQSSMEINCRCNELGFLFCFLQVYNAYYNIYYYRNCTNAIIQPLELDLQLKMSCGMHKCFFNKTERN